MTTLKAILWDVDGTLAETERDGHRIAFNQAFEAMGLLWRWDEAYYGHLLNITGGRDMSLYEVSEATSIIYEEAGEDANVIFGAVIDENLNDEVFITVIATGFSAEGRGVLQPPKQENNGEATAPKLLDLPTFMREKKKKNEEASSARPAAKNKTENISFDDEIDDLDIPTFLRKQMD